ncbi:M23 family metallopeptidase [Arenibaculum pallidiluteum]|uniref:M23 family metallopeptidase n=1 Tax=Arenibaculum pallidiluteum TaxID=2812559 RepID=UPI001F2A56C4|nr:M23 family metallopeptidase [Arenibaculum pallidiluteum]
MRRWVVILPAAAAVTAGLMGVSAHLSFEAGSDAEAPAIAQDAAPPLAPSTSGLPATVQDQPAAAEELPAVAADAPAPAADGPESDVIADPAGTALADIEATESPAEDEASLRHMVVEVGRGDTLLGVLVNAAVPRDEAIQAIDALRRVFNPRLLQAGQEIAVMFDRAGGQDRFMGLTITPNVQRSVTVQRSPDDSYEAKAVDRPLETKLVAASARISSSLFEAGVSAGVPIAVLSEVIKLFSYDVDFQRDIQRDDEFRVLYQRQFTDQGDAAGEGDILVAELTMSGKPTTFYRYKTRDGVIDYFNSQGESIRKALLRTPVDGARLTSGFGLRRHPILGYSKLHAGIDFGAPPGTPIYAAGAGTVDEAGAKGAYGNYVRIRHNKEISTAYAHMSRFAPGVKRGGRVRQGDVIGYVGSTGRSTGPHLHYEVLRNERQVNPMSIDLPTGQMLEGKELAAFRTMIAELERQYAEIRSSEPQIAETVGLKGVAAKDQPSAAQKACTDAPC